jgi:hypothetical protein
MAMSERGEKKGEKDRGRHKTTKKKLSEKK